MAGDKRYWGISINKGTFQGEVIEDPKFYDNGAGGQMAVIELVMYSTELSSNGQWVDTEVTVPITVLDQSKVESVRKYVMAGRQLYVETYYKSWMNDGVRQHANIATKISFGYKPKENNTQKSPVAVPQPQ